MSILVGVRYRSPGSSKWKSQLKRFSDSIARDGCGWLNRFFPQEVVTCQMSPSQAQGRVLRIRNPFKPSRRPGAKTESVSGFGLYSYSFFLGQFFMPSAFRSNWTRLSFQSGCCFRLNSSWRSSRFWRRGLYRVSKSGPRTIMAFLPARLLARAFGKAHFGALR